MNGIEWNWQPLEVTGPNDLQIRLPMGRVTVWSTGEDTPYEEWVARMTAKGRSSPSDWAYCKTREAAIEAGELMALRLVLGAE